MPAVSPKQYGLMQGIAHGSITGGFNSPTKAVAKEFVAKTPAKKRRKFAQVLANKKNGD
jgi:hypothetical protein